MSLMSLICPIGAVCPVCPVCPISPIDPIHHFVVPCYFGCCRLSFHPPHHVSKSHQKQQNKNANRLIDKRLTFLAVPRAGVEPARVAPLVFETSASTDSAIWARKSGAKLIKKVEWRNSWHIKFFQSERKTDLRWLR